MYVAIKSEIDSRPLIYPLMYALRSYGSVLVISSNRQLKRLIDDVEFETFRDINIIVDEEGAADEVLVEYGVAAGDYDFVIFDNMGCLEYDACFVLTGRSSSEAFEEELEMLKQSDDLDKLIFLNFGGTSKNKNKVKRGKKEMPNADEIRVAEEKVEEFDPGMNFRKAVGQGEKVGADIKEFTCKLPTFDDIELVEGDHKFYPVNDQISKAIYETFKQQISSDYSNFRRVVNRKDEGGSNIKPRPSRKE